MCNLCGIFLNGHALTQELKHVVLAAQIVASKVHSDGFGYFAAKKEANSVYGRTSVAAQHSMYPAGCMKNADATTTFMITHVRKASSGKVALPVNATENEKRIWNETITKMSHPFLGKVSVLAHNGTLTPKDGVEFEMDSAFLAEKFDQALLEQKDVFMALEEAFSFFKGGLASLMFAVKYPEGWYPYFYKGNKPLVRYLDQDTGIMIVITDEAYITKEITVLNTLYGYNFVESRIIKEGIYSWENTEPLKEVSLIKTPIVVQSAPAVVGAWQGGRTKGIFDTFVQKVGKQVLIDLTTRLLTEFTADELLKLAEFGEYDMVQVLERVQTGNVELAKNLIK
jgi:hypothetical protein